MENIGETMEYLNLPTRLKERINLYYWYAWSKSGSAASSKGTGQFLTELSEPLAMEVQLICHSNVIGNIPFFQNADSAVIRRVLDKIIPELFLPGDYIFRHGDTANKLYMIQSGEVEILDDQGLHLVTLGEGKYFGEVSLLVSWEYGDILSNTVGFVRSHSATRFHHYSILTRRFASLIADGLEENCLRQSHRLLHHRYSI